MTDDNNNKQLSPEVVDRLLAVQERQLVLKEKELDHSRQSMEYDHEYSLKSLDAQVKDRESMRKHESSNTKFRYTFAAIIIIGLFVLFIVAIKNNKDQIVMEILKAIIYVGVGALGGYSWGTKWKKSTNTDSE